MRLVAQRGRILVRLGAEENLYPNKTRGCGGAVLVRLGAQRGPILVRLGAQESFILVRLMG